ncbi:Alpha/Beta hydrolase protein [Usnea florida]
MAVIKPQLSLLERVTLILAILRSVGVGLIAIFTALFKRKPRYADFAHYVKIAMMRTFLKNTTIRHQQHIGVDIDVAYPAFAKKRGFTPKDVTLPDGTKAYWFGSPSAEKVILWFHGGGYTLPTNPGHLAFVSSLTSPTVSALMLSYTLAPHATYPRQLQQAASLLHHTLTALHYAPSNIIIAGDSAGGNMALGLISHLLHPHPEIPPLPLKDGAPLHAAILLAPWASFRHDWPSTRTNAPTDYVSSSVGDLWSAAFLGGRPRDAYNEPLAAGPGWWDGLGKVLGGCLVTVGGGEILEDVVRETGRRLGGGMGGEKGRVRVVVAGGEWHDRPVMNTFEMGGAQDGAVRGFVREWG